jgi:hypothetical protein
MWCIPEVDGTYVARMEDVLDLYAESPDGSVRNIVCGRSVGNLKQETHDAYQARTS